MNSNFSRLDPQLREFIYEKRWPSLKSIQEEAIPAILDSEDHVLIAAGTASGKTEACFFPVITKLLTDRRLKKNEMSGDHNDGSGVQVLYIGPLKALINDQFERLLPLLHEMDIPLWRWHGDVGRNHKQKLLKNPDGILQITPESLEALLLRQPGKISMLFGKMAFVIIDEVHAFIGTDRGSQLVCLLKRIQEIANPPAEPRRIGLSATLGNYRDALSWLKAGTGKEAMLINEMVIREGSVRENRRLGLAVDFCGGIPEEEFYEVIYDQCRTDSRVPGKCIIFTNSRLEAEETAAALKKIANRLGEEDHYQVHHGSIAAALREETERDLRESEGPQVIAATATLELGIDIGRLDKIMQIGAPMSVSAFVQRLGRSGRRSGVSRMYFCSREPAFTFNGSPLERIPWTLIKTIAVIQLYLEEQWTEDINPKPLPYSLLCHQTLSILASLGEQNYEEICGKVLSLPPFAEIGKQDYRELLFCLETGGYIERTEEGKFIAGLEGERMINHYSFYSLFPDEEEFRVTYLGKELGKVNFIPPEGSGLVLAGKNWKVDDLRLKSREICVIPGPESGARIWRGGSSFLHGKIVKRMRQVLFEDRIYPYLTNAALFRLQEGRDFARESGMEHNNFIAAEPDSSMPHTDTEKNVFYLLPWTGSRGMRTLSLVLQKKENKEELKIIQMEQENPYAYRIVSELDIVGFRSKLKRLIFSLKNPETLLDTARIPMTDKYDYLLPAHFLVKQYAANILSVTECKEFLQQD